MPAYPSLGTISKNTNILYTQRGMRPAWLIAIVTVPMALLAQTGANRYALILEDPPACSDLSAADRSASANPPQ